VPSRASCQGKHAASADDRVLAKACHRTAAGRSPRLHHHSVVAWLQSHLHRSSDIFWKKTVHQTSRAPLHIAPICSFVNCSVAVPREQYDYGATQYPKEKYKIHPKCARLHEALYCPGKRSGLTYRLDLAQSLWHGPHQSNAMRASTPYLPPPSRQRRSSGCDQRRLIL
jgi:hypothetical protein